MGFGGGGSAGMTAHVHNNVPLQGGPLDFANDTIASLNAGSTTFSDGAALQELVIGNAADTLVVNGAGTAPEWGAAGGGAWVSEGNDINTTPGTSLDVTVSDADVYQINYNVADGAGDYNALCLRVNDITTTTYKSLLSQGAALGGSQSDPELNTQTKFLLTGSAIERQCNGTVYVYKGDSNFLSGNQGVNYINQGMQNNRTDPYNWQVGGGTNDTITSAITKLSLLFLVPTTSGTDTIEGSIRVNSLTYS